MALNEREKEKVSPLTTPVVNVTGAWFNDIEELAAFSLWPRVFFGPAKWSDARRRCYSEVRPPLCLINAVLVAQA